MPSALLHARERHVVGADQDRELIQQCVADLDAFVGANPEAVALIIDS